MSDEPLTPSQRGVLRRDLDGDAGQLAQSLGLTRKRVDQELDRLRAEIPAYAPRESRWGLLLGGFLILLLTAIAYWNVSGSAYHFDDGHTALNTTSIPTLRRHMANVQDTDSPIRKLREFRRGMVKTTDALFKWNPFRVVNYLTFSIQDWQHGGLKIPTSDPGMMTDPFELRPKAAVHRFNVSVHALNGLLAMLVAYLTFTAPAFRRSLSGPRWPVLSAVLVGVIFALHPLQTQSVTYVTQRAEALAAMFYLLALGSWIVARNRRTHERAGSAPWQTTLIWCAAGLLLGVLLISARYEALKVGSALAAGFVVVAAAIAGVVAQVKRGADEPWHAVAVSVCFVAFGLGLETKEIVATLPLAIVAWELFLGASPHSEEAAASKSEGPWIKRAVTGLIHDRPRLRYAGPWVALVLVAGLGVLALGGRNVTSQMTATNVKLGGWEGVPLDAPTYLLTQANVAHTYARLAVLPYGQNLDRNYPLALQPTPLKEIYKTPPVSSGVVTLLSVLGLIAAAALALLYGGRARIPAFALLFGLVVLAPSSSVIVLADVIYEHRFYLPLFGAALVFAALVERGARLLPRHAQAGALIGLILVLGCTGVYLTKERNKVWRDGIALWKDVTEKSPGKARGWTNLGLEYQDRDPHVAIFNDPARTIEWCLYRLAPPDPKGQPRVLILRESLQTSAPRLVSGSNLREIKVMEGGEWEDTHALEVYAKALEADPYYHKALNNVALIYLTRRHNDRAEADIITHQMIPEYEKAGQPQMVTLCRKRLDELDAQIEADTQKALDAFLKQEGVHNFHRMNNLGNLYSLLHDYPNATKYLAETLKYAPNFPARVYAVVGSAYMNYGQSKWSAFKLGLWKGVSEEQVRAEMQQVFKIGRHYLNVYFATARPSEPKTYIEPARRAAATLNKYLNGTEMPTVTPQAKTAVWTGVGYPPPELK